MVELLNYPLYSAEPIRFYQAFFSVVVFPYSGNHQYVSAIQV